MLSRVPLLPVHDDDADTPRFSWERWAGLAVAVAACVYVAAQLHPDLWLRNTTPNGGDLGAHVWWPAFLRDHWFGRGRLAGWAPDWYAGFPAGQFYFPVPALLISLLDLLGLPYNVAFKLVAMSGPVLLPLAAYQFARGLRFPWPAPPVFAVVAVRYLFEIRRGVEQPGKESWTIYGGNLASTLAGEFSFTIALVLALLFLAALARSLDRGRRLWLPASLLALTVLSHIVVGAFAAAAAVLVWLLRRPNRTVVPALAIAAVGALLTTIWTLPLLSTQDYTQSMRYEKVLHYVKQLDHPSWVWMLAGIAVVAAGWWRRKSTGLLVALAVGFAFLFRFWPEHHVWNTRFLPFYWLSVMLLAGMGVVELARFAGMLFVGAADWVNYQGPLAPGADAPTDGEAGPETAAPAVWRPPAVERREAEHEAIVVEDDPADPRVRRGLVLSSVVTAVVVAVAMVWSTWWVHDHRYFVPSWAKWNFSGYEAKPAYGEYREIIDTMSELPPGRALWEPSGDIDKYGTTLALMLLPYWTHGRIGSMEGIYFESSATTAYHFLTVSRLAAAPSNPVRGLAYGSTADFDQGVRQLRKLGVRYFMAQSDDVKARADADPDLRLVAEVPDRDGQPPKGWKIYEVSGVSLVEPLASAPVVVPVEGGTSSECFGKDEPPPGANDPELPPWECAAAPWWMDATRVDRPFTTEGPQEWPRATLGELGTTPAEPLPEVEVSEVRTSTDHVRFHVSRTGVPVVVKVSYFPNWKVSGADGPWRISPNFMVVVPTSKDVTLTYGLTKADWLGRVGFLLGLVGLVLLARWRPSRRQVACPEEHPEGPDAPEGGDLEAVPAAPHDSSAEAAEQAAGTPPAAPALP